MSDYPGKPPDSGIVALVMRFAHGSELFEPLPFLGAAAEFLDPLPGMPAKIFC